MTKDHSKQTVTGRSAASEPPIQNVPVRTEEGRLIRDAFADGVPWKHGSDPTPRSSHYRPPPKDVP